MTSTLIGLARVSTGDQDLKLQLDALKEAGCIRTFEEKISGSKNQADRPELKACLDYLRPGDTLCIWKLDRLGRSVKDVLTIAEDLHAKGIGLKILTGRLAGTYQPTGEGKFFFTMMAAFAELERDIIRERTVAGLAAAKTQDRAGGRPWVRNDQMQADARRWHDQGVPVPDIARRLVIPTGKNAGKHPSRATVYRCLQEAP